MADQAWGSGSSDDVGELYEAHARRLRQIVGGGVRAPEPVIEDACQVAWVRLLRHRGHVRRDAALAWLVTTAIREAARLLRRASRETPLDTITDAAATHVAGPEDLVEWRTRLDRIGDLPQRQQQLIWLQGFGLSYREMSGYTGASRRTVERQLMRAKRSLRAD